MALRGMNMGLVMVLVMTLWAGAMAQQSCINAITNLMPCLNYITGNSSVPSPACCSQLAGVVRSQPQCLCLVINGTAASLGLNINQTLAMQLPTACNVQTPSVSICTASSAPETAPASSPSFSPSGEPTSSEVPPQVAGGDPSNDSSTTPKFSLVMLLLLVASYGATHSSF
ncbi:non-specific lipid transfer protein GPI-anchored 5-like [Tasmannia lanceolata]|uniref:non-specific lipid transfer protein GPI-anchored 5-like n=1 Tax=Tasmannia lanceolata TaxID=3420 RepID=UPI00406350B3